MNEILKAKMKVAEEILFLAKVIKYGRMGHSVILKRYSQ